MLGVQFRWVRWEFSHYRECISSQKRTQQHRGEETGGRERVPAKIAQTVLATSRVDIVPLIRACMERSASYRAWEEPSFRSFPALTFTGKQDHCKIRIEWKSTFGIPSLHLVPPSMHNRAANEKTEFFKIDVFPLEGKDFTHS